jgi:cytochrome P450
MNISLDALVNWLTGPVVLRPVFALLRRFSPIFVLGKKVVVSRHADVIEVLSRDTDFTVSQINAPNIDRLDGPFILGMDRSEQYDREAAVLREAVRKDDLQRIRTFVARTAAEIVGSIKAQERIDIVNGFARPAATRLVASYFGVSGPDERTLMRWLRDIFRDVFLNFTNDTQVREAANRSGARLRQHLDQEIVRRKAQPEKPDDVLGRLLALRGSSRPWLDDDTVRRNVSGLIVGAVETTSKFVAHSINELLRRPEIIAGAREAAATNNIEAVRRYAYEAVRFNPHAPLMLRYCARETALAVNTPRERRLPAGSTVLVGTLSAMFDSEGFASPNEFRIDREVEYLHFGYGMHRCFGYYINSVQISELMAALLRLPNLRRASGSDGRIVYEGPFPDRLILEFDLDSVITGKG